MQGEIDRRPLFRSFDKTALFRIIPKADNPQDHLPSCPLKIGDKVLVIRSDESFENLLKDSGEIIDPLHISSRRVGAYGVINRYRDFFMGALGGNRVFLVTHTNGLEGQDPEIGVYIEEELKHLSEDEYTHYFLGFEPTANGISSQS